MIYNRLRQGMPLGIDATIRFATGNWSGRSAGRELRLRLRLQHAHAHGPAAGADRQPRAGVDPCGGAPGADDVPLLRGQAVRQRRARLLEHASVSSSATRRATSARARSAAGARRPPVDRVRGGRRLSGRAQPLAGDDARRASASSELDWRYFQLPVPPERFAETLAALPASGYVGANVTIPHKLAALDLADERPRRPRDRRGEHADFQDGRIEADNTDAGGIPRRARGATAGTALVLGAGGAARAVVWALREAGVDEVGVWNRTPSERRASRAIRRARGSAARAGRAGGERDLGGARAGRRGRSLGLGRASRPRSSSTSSTATGRRAVERWASGARRSRRRRPRGARPPGGAQSRALVRVAALRSTPCEKH